MQVNYLQNTEKYFFLSEKRVYNKTILSVNILNFSLRFHFSI